MRNSVLGLAFIIVIITSLTPLARSDPQEPNPLSRNIVLYAQFDEALAAINKKSLSPTPPDVKSNAIFDNATVENLFTLYPSAGSELPIDGAVIFRAYLQSDSSINGRLIYSLYEVLPSGNRTVITRIEGYIAVTTIVDGYTFGVAGIRYTVKSGSTIQLSIHFIPSRPDVKTYLWWNSVKTATNVIIPFVDHIKVKVSASDTVSNTQNFFSLNGTRGLLNLTIKANITDPFGIRDIKAVNVSIIDTQGTQALKETPMSVETVGAGLYQAVYGHNVSLARGIYNIIIRVVDSSGNSYMHQGSIGASYFNHIFILLKDGQGSPIPEKECVIVNQLLKMEVRGITNSTGSLEMVLPSSDVAGEYGVLIRWENYTFNIPFSTLNLLDRTVDLRLPIYELKVKILFYLIPMPLANVTLYRGSKWIANGTTGWSGSTSFHQIPADKYRLHVDYFYQKYDQEIEVEGPQEVVVTIRDRYILSLMVLGLIAIIGALLVAALKTQDKPRKHPFSFIDKIIEDGLPFEASIMISGPPASGKSVLMSNMMNESLRKGRKCIYIINTDFPSKVRENLENLDVDVKKHEKEKRFLIIDCYSGVAGKTSSEAHHVDSVTDLTRIGIELSLCLEELGHKTDIYFDSFSTALAALKPEQITSFLHTTGAKVKGLSGRFCFTVGTDLPKDLISKMDEASDCSIELTVERMDHEVQRMLWIKKVRGKWHYTRAIPFIIEKRRGVVFLAPKKILKRSYP